jgi:uncharacterized membrane protein
MPAFCLSGDALGNFERGAALQTRERTHMAARIDETTTLHQPKDLNSVLARNVRALADRSRKEAERATVGDRLSEAITAFTGSMTFVILHLIVLIIWVLINLGWLFGIRAFDPDFIILATAASVEAIFLSTFVLISQNRAADAARHRAELDLQINLLAEHELTRLIALNIAVAEHLGVSAADDPSLAELKKHVAPEKVLDRIAAEKES